MDQQRYLKETGVVVGIEGEFAFVKTQRNTGCSGCSSESGCGTSALAKLFTRDNSAPLKVIANQSCDIGDEVELLLDESRLLKHSFMAYGLPLIGLFFMAILLGWLAQNVFNLNASQAECFAILGALLGLFAGWKVTKTYYQPVLPELGKVLKKSTQSL